jgi:electron transport complex protein RnfG
MKNIKLGMVLMLFCIISAGLLAGVFIFTQPKIDANSGIAFESSLRDALPADKFEKIEINGEIFYKGFDKGTIGKQSVYQLVGYAVPVSSRGYSGAIQMVVGINLSGMIVNVVIVDQKETPGLGAKIIIKDFLSQFTGKKSSDKIGPKEDIDAITGATISTAAVCQGAKEALKKYLMLMEKNTNVQIPIIGDN